ncbi:MAG: hypothetical protein IJ121_11835 [Eubacterium sp.]|nr:hypothetical protein [Eubacterium sp.]
MNRKKYISAGIQLALHQAGGPARRLLKKHIRKKMKQSVSGLIRKPGLQTSVRFADGRRILAGINAAGVKSRRRIKPKKQKLRTKALVRILKYAMRETRYS